MHWRCLAYFLAEKKKYRSKLVVFYKLTHSKSSLHGVCGLLSPLPRQRLYGRCRKHETRYLAGGKPYGHARHGLEASSVQRPQTAMFKNIKLFKSAKRPTESNYFYLWDPDSLLLQKIELATSPFWTLVNSWDLKRFDTREDKERVRE